MSSSYLYSEEYNLYGNRNFTCEYITQHSIEGEGFGDSGGDGWGDGISFLDIQKYRYKL